MYPIHSGESYDELPRDGALRSGSCRFSNSRHEPSKWIEVTKDCLGGQHPSGGHPMVRAVREQMLSTGRDGWGLEPPSVVISVTGAAASLKVTPKLEQIFRRGLRKAAAITRAWIITGGTKSGVMELVGKTVREADVQVPCIGIAPWGAVKGFESLEAKHAKVANYDRVLGLAGGGEAAPPTVGKLRLDPYHSHFILYDDGSRGKAAYYKEVKCRQDFEESVCNHGRNQHTLHDAGLAVQAAGRMVQAASRIAATPVGFTTAVSSPGAVQVGVEAPRSGSPCPHEPAAYSYQDPQSREREELVRDTSYLAPELTYAGDPRGNDLPTPALNRGRSRSGFGIPSRPIAASSVASSMMEETRPLPMVLVVLGGGLGTLKTVEGCIASKKPVVVLPESHGVAAAIAAACEVAPTMFGQELLSDEHILEMWPKSLQA